MKTQTKYRTRKIASTAAGAAGEARRIRVADLAEYSLAMRRLQERFPDASTVVDATRDKMLLVTDADVQAGEPKNPGACAVAQCAMREGIGGMIGRQFAYLVQGHEVTRYSLGKNAQVRTAIFDDRGTMTSGPVVLSVPAPSDRLLNMTRRQSQHRAAARKNRKLPRSKRGAILRNEAEAVRTSIMSQGFRSWNQM